MTDAKPAGLPAKESTRPAYLRPGWKRATWTRGKQRLIGQFIYNWGSDRFIVLLDTKDRVTGRERTFPVYGDEPEWNGYKLERTNG